MLVFIEVRKWNKIPWNWYYKWLLNIHLGTVPRSSTRTRALNYWAISLAPSCESWAKFAAKFPNHFYLLCFKSKMEDFPPHPASWFSMETREGISSVCQCSFKYLCICSPSNVPSASVLAYSLDYFSIFLDLIVGQGFLPADVGLWPVPLLSVASLSPYNTKTFAGHLQGSWLYDISSLISSAQQNGTGSLKSLLSPRSPKVHDILWGGWFTGYLSAPAAFDGYRVTTKSPYS